MTGRDEGRLPEDSKVARADPKSQLPNLSTKLLAASEMLQRLEREKRKVPISTPEFHRLADEVEDLARRIFGLSTAQEQAGDLVPTDGDSIDDVARTQLP